MEGRMMKRRGVWIGSSLLSHVLCIMLGVTLTYLLLMTSSSQQRSASVSKGGREERNDLIQISPAISNDDGGQSGVDFGGGGGDPGLEHDWDRLPGTDEVVRKVFVDQGLARDVQGMQQLPSLPSDTASCSCPEHRKLEMHNILFGIASSASLWKDRQEYIKLWWKPGRTRGFVFLDEEPEGSTEKGEKVRVLERDGTGPSGNQQAGAGAAAPFPAVAIPLHPLPEIRVSEGVDNFTRSDSPSVRAAVRIARIVNELFRMNLPEVTWFLLGDDDTIFCVENLLPVLSRFDPTQMHYLGSASESHQQNIYFSMKMAYGGAGIAISYPLARALVETQGSCLLRYSKLPTSDSYLHACISEIGIQMTKVEGFHQTDLKGNIVGLLESHPVTPFLSVHHLSGAAPMFPGLPTLKAAQQFVKMMNGYPAGFLQQSLCYDPTHNATVSIAWGFTVRWFPGWFTVREMERAERTFLAWNHGKAAADFSIDTRAGTVPICNIPAVFQVSSVTEPYVGMDGQLWVESEYQRGWLLNWLRVAQDEDSKKIVDSKRTVDSKKTGDSKKSWDSKKTGDSKKTTLRGKESGNGGGANSGTDAEGVGGSKQKMEKKASWVKLEGPKRRLLFGGLCPNGLRRVPTPLITVVKVRAPVLTDAWFANPRRQCCKNLRISAKDGLAEIELGPCGDGESIAWS